MNIQFSDIAQQKREMERYAGELEEIRIKLKIHRNLLEEAWVADEIEGIEDVIDRMNRKINEITDEMYRIGNDFIKAYEELSEEESE